MIKQKRKQALFIGFTISFVVISGIFLSRLLLTQAQNAEPRTQPNLAGARIVDLDEPEWRQNVTLEVLGREGSVIVIGKPLSNVCRLSANEHQVTTDYRFEVQEVIKGDFNPNSVIVVKMPGGIAKQSDGTLLDVRTHRVRKMQNGKTYAVFLKGGNRQNDSLVPLRGSQGIFEIPATGTRVIHLGRPFNLPPADDGPEINAFLQTIRAMETTDKTI